MANIQEYTEYYEPETVPEALVKLLEFQEAHGGYFSQGFELEVTEDDAAFSSYSDKSEFLDRLFQIGQADPTGSTYALWHIGGTLADSPVLVFGSEGGIHVVAENLSGLFRILTLDAEPMISWDQVTYYRSPDEEPSASAPDYVEWLKKNFKLTPVENATEVEQIVDAAQKAHATAFNSWLKKFYA